MNTRNTFIGSGIAFLLATACCWLPLLAISVGGASTLAAINNSLGDYTGAFMAIGTAFLGLGIFQIYKKNKNNAILPIKSHSTITCPSCGYKKEEIMPTSSCQYFYECENCKKVLKPLQGDCCVFCSYGTVACPPIQSNISCC